MLKSKWILIPAAALLLLSGCAKQTAEPKPDEQTTLPASEAQTLQQVTENAEAEIMLPLDDEQTAANTTKPTDAAKTTTAANQTTIAGQTTAPAQSTTAKAAESKASGETTAAAGSTAQQTTKATTTQKDSDSILDVGGKTASTTQSGTLSTTDSGKDRYELPAIPLN
ncbi:MAG: hypothetical protein IJU96_02935 [Clostridia bacterium]|nr:hypothetical protein [Clostridia bacterium]